MLAATNQILIIQTAFIGDAILASSLIETWHAQYPDSSIDLLVRKGNESLYDGPPFLNECLIWNKKEGKYTSLMNLLKIFFHRYKATELKPSVRLHKVCREIMRSAVCHVFSLLSRLAHFPIS